MIIILSFRVISEIMLEQAVKVVHTHRSVIPFAMEIVASEGIAKAPETIVTRLSV